MHSRRATPSPAAFTTRPATRPRSRYLRWFVWAFLAGLLLGTSLTFAYDLQPLLRRPPCLVGLVIGAAALFTLARRRRT